MDHRSWVIGHGKERGFRSPYDPSPMTHDRERSEQRPMTSEPMTYADAGVEVCAAEENVRRIAGHVRSTHGPAVLGSFGAFAGLFQFPDLRDPVLVASADNIGTKLQLALQFGRYESMGRDLVNLNVNDVLTTGARPLFFLDYVAVHKLKHEVVEEFVRGMAAACRENACALLGGE